MRYFNVDLTMARILEQTAGGLSKTRSAPGPAERHDLDADEATLPLLQALQRLHGDICRVPAVSRSADGYVVHDPDAIRHLLLTNRGNYVKGVGTDRLRMLLGNGLITSDGSDWARQRRLAQPAFHGQVLRGFAPLFDRVNAALIRRWAAGDGVVELTHDLSVATLEIVLQALFGSDLDTLRDADGRHPFELLTQETRRDLPFAARFRGLARHVQAIANARRAQRRVEPDLLGMLMQARDADSGEPMPDRALIDEVMTLIVAGHETSASALAWTWSLLAQHADAQDRLHAALEAGDDGPVERVVQEAMRLYPPVWLFSRRAVAADVLGGWDIPAGSDIFVCPYLLHRHPAHWQRPDDFDPSRFEPDVAAGRHRYAYLPFSAGPRLCIGAGFAMAEMTAHVAMVARRFRVEHAGDTVPPLPAFQINLRPRDPMPMRLLPR